MLAGSCACPRAPDSYYVTVAGLGGEPDYEQRFTELAHDLDTLVQGFRRERARLYADRQPTPRARTSATRSARSPRRPSRMTTSC